MANKDIPTLKRHLNSAKLRSSLKSRTNEGRLPERLPCFCTLCLEPINEGDTFCAVCSQKTTAVSIFEKIQRDDRFSRKERNYFAYSPFVIIAAALVQLLVLAAVILFAISSSRQTVSNTQPVSMTDETDEKTQRINEEIRKAVYSSDWESYLNSHSYFSKEDLEIYTYAWNTAGLVRDEYIERDETQARLEAERKKAELEGKPAATKNANVVSSVWVIQIAAVGFAAACGIVTAVYAALFLLKRHKAVYPLINLCKCSCESGLLTLNVVSVLAFYFCCVNLCTSVSKAVSTPHSLEYKKMLASRHIGERGEWVCDGCGYLNTDFAGECRSCGKYR